MVAIGDTFAGRVSDWKHAFYVLQINFTRVIMKRKLLLAALLSVATAACAAGFAACGGFDNTDADKPHGEEHLTWGEVYTISAAYDKAQELGYTGTLEEFIEAISGKDGAPGRDGQDGQDGQNGEDGLSAYEIYIKYHPEYEGTEEEWIENLKGAQGEKGDKGENGKNGVGIEDIYINDMGELIIVGTDGNTLFQQKLPQLDEEAPPQPKQNFEYKLAYDGKSYAITDIGTVTNENIVIPSTYNGLPVTKIADEAFYNCSSIKSVIISEGITEIGIAAFCNCFGLENITIPKGVDHINSYTLGGCCNLTNITLSESLTTIDANAFASCTSLASITLPESLTTIGANAFASCTSLTSIYYAGSSQDWKWVGIDKSNNILFNSEIIFGKEVEFIQTNKFEAEYIDLTNKQGVGFSGSPAGTDLICFSDTASNEAYLGYLYCSITLEFEVIAEHATDATLILNLGSEIGNFTYDSSTFSITINGTELKYDPFEVKQIGNGLSSMGFNAIEVGTVNLQEGENLIVFEIHPLNNSTSWPHTLGCLFDYMELADCSGIGWYPEYRNLKR